MAPKKPMRENISGRPTDSSGLRASDIDLGLVRSPVKKPMPEGISSRPTDKSGKRATDADLGMTRAAPKSSFVAKVAKAVGQRAPTPAPKSSFVAKVAKAVGQTPRTKPVQVIRTTTAMKSTPTAKKR